MDRLHLYFFGLLGWALQSLWLAMLRAVPKRGKKARKRRRPLPRRGPFRVNDNPFKAYRPPNQEMVASAHDRRARHLANPTNAEIAFNEILKGLGLIEDHDYERESIWFYPGSYALFDFFFKARKLIFEVDGSAHDDRGQKRHDEERDLYFARQGLKTVRIKNRVVRTRPDVCRELIMVEIAGVHASAD